MQIEADGLPQVISIKNLASLTKGKSTKLTKEQAKPNKFQESHRTELPTAQS